MTDYIVRTLAGTLAYEKNTNPVQGTTFVVKISGNPVFVLAGSLKIDLSIGQNSQASFTCVTDVYTHFKQYQRVTIFDTTQRLIFNGYITNPQEQQVGFQKTLTHTITAQGPRYLASKRIIAKVYKNKTCGTMVMDILRNILSQEGVSNGVICDGLLPSTVQYPSHDLYPNGNVGAVPNTTFAYCTVADALDALATEASNAGIPYYWNITEDRELYFAPYTAIVNNNIVDGTQIDQVNSPCTVKRQNPKYRNRQYLTGGVAETVQQAETFMGDGHSTTWTLKYAVAHDEPAILRSTVGGPQWITQTIGLKGTNGAEYYWSPGDSTISQDTGLPALQPNESLTIIYTGQYPTVTITQNNGQIAAQALIDETSGIIEAVDEDKNLTTAGSGILEASQLLTKYCVEGTILQFTTQWNTYRPGQLITVNLPNHALNNAQMLVITSSAADNIDNLNIWWTVTAVMGPYDTNWVQFFSKVLTPQYSATDISVGSSVTPPTAPTLTLYDAAMRFRLQTSGGQVPTAIFHDAALRFRLQSTSSTPVSVNFSLTRVPTIKVTPTVTGTGGGTYPTFSGPDSRFTGKIQPYSTTSDQALRVFKFGDNTNSSTGNTDSYTYGTNILVYWCQIESSEGSYNWSYLDGLISPWTSNGKKIILRIMTCGQKSWNPPYSQQGTPQWVFDAGVPHYDCGKGIVPEYWHPTFISKFNAMIAALGARYNGNSNIEFVQAAVGMGGECKPDTTAKAGDATLTANLKGIGFNNDVWWSFVTQTIDKYRAAFPSTKLAIQSAAFFDSADFGGTKHNEADIVNYAKTKGYGLQNDGIVPSSTGVYTAPDTNWNSAAFISCEQKNAVAKSGDIFEGDIEAMISFCQGSKPIYLLVFKDDLYNAANTAVIQKYSCMH